MTVQYKTEIVADKHGKRTKGYAYVQQLGGAWKFLGETNYMRVYPQAVRASIAADNICKRYHKAHHAAYKMAIKRV